MRVDCSARYLFGFGQCYERWSPRIRAFLFLNYAFLSLRDCAVVNSNRSQEAVAD